MHRSPPAGLALRSATLDDASAIAALVNDVSSAEVGVPWTDAGQVVDDLTSTTRIPGLDDVVLVDADDRVAAYLGMLVTPEPFQIDFLVWARPDLDGAGVYSWLLRYGEREAAHHRASSAPFTISAGRFLGNDAAASLFASLEFAYARTFWMMRAGLDGVPERAIPPDGVEIRPFDPTRDERGVFGALREAFDDHWGSPFPSFDEWRHLLVEGAGAGYDPGLWFVALEDGDVVGALTARASSPRDDRAAFVTDLGVRRAARRRGIAEALLRAAFAEARARGIPRVELVVDAESPTGATRLYERAGMRVAYGWEIWQKTI
jgi:ribosomal protein S18 acetylase RimI-like enzyme